MLSWYKKRNIALLGGHVVECFDNTLYGFFAVMLAPIFFPKVGEYNQVLAAFGAFAAGFMFRPIGAIIFGLIGDTKGRQLPILWSMGFVSIPTLIIGLIPSYATLGVFSPIILLVCLVLQGICMGGEFAGVNVYNAESDEPSTLGARTGLLIGMGVMGAILATILGAIFSMQVMPSWAWRIPFILGGLMAMGIFFLRRNIGETKEFLAARSNNVILHKPWKEILSLYKSKVFLASVIAGLTIMPLYCTTILGNAIYKDLGYSVSQSLCLNTFSMFLDVIVIMVYGRMADSLGFRKQMILGTSMIALTAFPAFYVISLPTVSTINVFTFILMLVFVGGIINGCALPYISSFFPTNCRYSAVAFSVTAGHALFGGTTPLISSYLQQNFNSRFAPAFWLFSVACIALIGIVLKEYNTTKRVDNMTATA